MRVLIDTNVLLDLLCDRDEFAEDALKIWELCEFHEIDGYISALSVPNIVYILRKELTPEKTEELVEKLSAIFEISDLKLSDLLSAAKIRTKDFEDAVQMLTAQRIRADYIITRNIDDFSASKISAIKPSEFFKKL